MNNEVLMTYDVPEGHYYHSKPFVYYKDGNLYLEHFMVLEQDKEMVLRAVSEYKRPEKSQHEFYHQDLAGASNKKYDNMYDYWFSEFVYQAMGGGLVLWHDIHEGWNQELARRGVHRCPKCGTKTVMYYRPFCPACDEVTKYKGALNLFEIAYKLSHRYGVNYNEYTSAFGEYCEEFGNDRVCDGYMPKRSAEDNEQTKRMLDRLEEINMSYPFANNLFWVSW